MADLKYITIRAEIIDDETAVIRGVDFQYMISRSDLERNAEWTQACSRMMSDFTRRKNGQKTGGHNKPEDKWQRQANTWSGILRKRSMAISSANAGARKPPATNWEERSVQLLRYLYARDAAAKLDKWSKWGQNKNIGKRAVTCVE